MLAVAQIDYIRFETNQKGNTYAEIARRMGVDPRTVKKYADQEVFLYRKRQERPSPVMDPVKPILDKWIKEDLKKKKKYHRTAKRMFQQLQDFHCFEGSYRSVRHYVSKRRKDFTEQQEEAALPLDSLPGTAQVDFGQAPFEYQSETIDLPYLVMSFPYSNTFYFQVFPSENTECLLEGLGRIFQYIGGVPKTIRFDNLSPAVKKIRAKGERELTDTFQRFVLHYGFSYEFCNPGKGNEKGHVEAMVKYVRNNFFLPSCTITDLEQFNSTLWEMAEKDRDRMHYQKQVLQSTLFTEDQAEWLMLPEKPFECVTYLDVRADKAGLVAIDKKLYSTSPRFAKQKVTARITYNRINLFTPDNERIVSHSRLYGARRKSMVWQPYLELLSRRPRAVKYSSIFDQFPPQWSDYLRACTEEEQRAALRLLASLLKSDDFSSLNRALEQAMAYGHPTADQIKHCFYGLLPTNYRYTAITPKQALPDVPAAARGTSHYDIFFSKGGEVE